MTEADYGTCPHCGKKYQLKMNDTIRRHNGPYPECFTNKNQLPLELIGAILAIAELENGQDNGDREE